VCRVTLNLSRWTHCGGRGRSAARLARERAVTPAPPIAACRVRACAKVNLDLRVLGVRRTGYHDLATVFQSVDLTDELRIEPGRHEGIVITCSDPRVPRDERNLVWRAAHLLCRESTSSCRPPDFDRERIPARPGWRRSADAARCC